MALLLSSFHNDSTEPQNDDRFTVVLDAGHGGHDPGNLGNGYYEKNIALNIVLEAGKLLEKNPDIKVIYTRKDDTFVDLYVRGEIANKAGADLFVSVHCDSHTSKAQGAGTFVLGLHANKQNFEIAKKENSVIYLEDDYKERYADYDIDSPESVIGLTIMQEEFLDQSIVLAKHIQDKFTEDLGRTDRKVKQAGFIVLHQTFMPSVLVETGFLTNDREGAYLNSKKGQAQMGRAIGEAILTYKESVMANVADFGPGAIAEAPDPEKADTKEAITERTAKGGQGDETQRDAGTAPSKETAQIIEESKSRSESGTGTESAEKGPAEVIVGARPKSADKSKGALDTEEDEGPAEVIVGARPKITDKKEDRPSTGNDGTSTTDIPRITYKVQIMASAKDFPLRPQSFNGLSRVAKEPYKNLYRYVYGSTSSLREAKMLKSNADLKGYPSSFIVVYKDGERTTFKESKKYISGQ